VAEEQPLYQVFKESRLPVSRAVGPMWDTKRRAALAAYDLAYQAWDEAYKYYSHHQEKTLQTPNGTFQRGDMTENILYANLNTIIPATLSRNPDIACSSTDPEDEKLIGTLQTYLNKVIRKPSFNLKSRLRRMILHSELTNFGVVKLDFTIKDDSREEAQQSLAALTTELQKARTKGELEAVYGKLQALEEQLEVREPGGFKLSNVLPHNLLVDPNAQNSDGSDAEWEMERTWLPTEYLRARFAKKGMSILKPTHKVKLDESTEAEDVSTLIMEAVAVEDANLPSKHADDERLSYMYKELTEVYYVWDKITRRVMLFLRDDWKWPLWVWDDPLQLSRFFPYYILSYGIPTSGIVGVGEVGHYLDHQDEVNAINKQFTNIRRTIFNYFIYNSNVMKQNEAEKLIKAIRSAGKQQIDPVGVDMPPEAKLSEAMTSVTPPSIEYKVLFDKSPVYDSVDRLGSTSDAIRGVQFKANTTVPAVEAYMNASRIRIGTKIDAIEDMIADLCHGISEIAISNLVAEDIALEIGAIHAKHWREMDVPTFNSNISVQIVAGSIEKPTSVFKKQEAVQIVQAIGQFANSAPGVTLKIILKVLEKAFTEVVISKEDWEQIAQEVAAMQTRGVSTQGVSTPPQEQLPPELEAMLAAQGQPAQGQGRPS
jgi:hypothetical protein